MHIHMRSFLVKVFMLVVFALVPLVASAQCSMCRAAAENSIAEGSTQALGLNFGILYLLSFPFLAVSLLGYIWFRQQQKIKSA